jgi:hypothetical protein
MCSSAPKIFSVEIIQGLFEYDEWAVKWGICYSWHCSKLICSVFFGLNRSYFFKNQMFATQPIVVHIPLVHSISFLKRLESQPFNRSSWLSNAKYQKLAWDQHSFFVCRCCPRPDVFPDFRELIALTTSARDGMLILDNWYEWSPFVCSFLPALWVLNLFAVQMFQYIEIHQVLASLTFKLCEIHTVSKKNLKRKHL